MSKPARDSKLVFSTESGDLRKQPSSVGLVVQTAGPMTVRLDTKSRRGKVVTEVTNVPGTDDDRQRLARTLKNECGAGGTVEGTSVMVQGDHRDKVVARLQALGFKPVRR